MGPAALRPDDDDAAAAEPERAEAELRAVASAPPPAIDSLTHSLKPHVLTHSLHARWSCRVETLGTTDRRVDRRLLSDTKPRDTPRSDSGACRLAAACRTRLPSLSDSGATRHAGQVAPTVRSFVVVSSPVLRPVCRSSSER